MGGDLALERVDPRPADQEELLSEKRRALRLAAAAREALGALDARERFIAEQRCMADPEDALSLADIGRHFGVSRERARQLEERAKRKLRALLASELSEEPASVCARGEHA